MTKIEILRQEARDEFNERYGNATDGANGAMFAAMLNDQDDLISSVYRAAIEDAKEAVRHGLLFGATLNAEGEAKGGEALKNLDELMPGV